MRLTLGTRYAALISTIILTVVAVLWILYAVQFRGFSAELRAQSAATLRANLIAEIEDRGGVVATVLSERLVNPLYRLDLARLYDLLSEAVALEDVEYAFLVGSDGRVLHDATRQISRFGEAWSVPGDDGADRGVAGAVRNAELITELRQPVALAGEELGVLYLGMSLAHISEQTQGIDGALATLLAEHQRRGFITIAIYSLTLLAAGIGLAFAISGGFARPIRELADFATGIGFGQRGEPPHLERSDEIGLLSNSLQAMSENLRRSSGEAEFLAYHDSLTRLPNRAQLKRYLETAIERALNTERTLALLFVDLDDFKKVNDTLGHEAGDEFLKAFSSRLADTIARRENDEGQRGTIARLGGDEFTIILEDIDSAATAISAAEDVLALLESAFVVSGQPVVVGASIGITICPEHSRDIDALLRYADLAMYRAKEEGRNNYCVYEPSMDGTATKRFSLEADLRRSIQNDQLELYYQPIVEAEGAAVTAVEALCRWRHPVLGEVQPSQFIKLAEDIGEIEHLDRWVITRLTRELSALREAGLGALCVSANLATLHLGRRAIAAHIEERLAEHALPGSSLRIEATEKSIMRNLGRTARAMQALDDLGVSTWIDDFGTRISTLKHIDALPVSGIKIDRDLIQGLADGENQRSVIRAITALAHSHGLSVTAEGIETKEQLDHLREVGCEYAQGYLFGRPMPLEDLMAYLRRQKRDDDGRLVLVRTVS